MSSTASRALSGQRIVVSLISAGHCYSHLTSVAVAPLLSTLYWECSLTENGAFSEFHLRVQKPKTLRRWVHATSP